jgi:hypothetical protein
MNEEWKCCDCPTSMACNHKNLWSFSNLGNNQFKIDDFNAGNLRCEKHFKIKDYELDQKHQESMVLYNEVEDEKDNCA